MVVRLCFVLQKHFAEAVFEIGKVVKTNLPIV